MDADGAGENLLASSSRTYKAEMFSKGRKSSTRGKRRSQSDHFPYHLSIVLGR